MEDVKDDISIKLEKQSLIREEIITKGYDSMQFIEYLIQCKGPGGEDINSWSLTDLKHAIKDFIYLNQNNNKSQQENNQQNKLPNIEKPLSKNQTEKDSKLDMPAPGAPQEKNLSESVLMNLIEIKNNIFTDSSKKNEKINYGLNTPDSVDCRQVEKTQLSEHEEIFVKIGFPEKIDGGFFGRNSVLFTVTAIPLGFVVKRDYIDFEWLQNTLIKLYSANFIPSLPQMFTYQNKNNQDLFFKECNRNLEKFINYLIADPIIRSSQILYDFLCEEKVEVFKRKQKEYENVTPCNDIQNYQSITGKIDINITEKTEKDYASLKSISYHNQKLFRQLNYYLISIEDDFNNIIKKLNETTKIWEQLYKLNEKANNNEKYIKKDIYTQMKNMFISLEKAIKKENDLLKINIKENFFFFFNNLNNFEQVVKKADNYKNIYLKEEKDLVSLKNDLYNKKTNVGSKIGNNIDLSNLLPKNTEATLEMKKNYGYYLNRAVNEYDRMQLLDNNIFKTNIKKSFKDQIDITKTFEEEIKKIISTLDELEKEKPNNINEIKKDEEKKNNNNAINSK